MDITSNELNLLIFTGIIESDDIQYITTEIDKAMNFSRKVQILIDSVKKKYRNRYVSFVYSLLKVVKTPSAIKANRN